MKNVCGCDEESVRAAGGVGVMKRVCGCDEDVWV